MNSKPSYDHPREIDVCCGRGKGIWSHPGNVKFQEIIAQNIHRYTSASSRNEKSVVIISVVEIMRQRGARFVKRDDETGLWHAVGEYQAREKTAHAIRDHLAKMARRRSQEARQAKQKSEQEKNESGGDGSKSQIDSSMSKQSNKGPASSKGGKTASARRNHKDTEQKRPNKSSDNKPSLAMSSNLAAGIEMGRQQSGKSVVESLGMDAAMSATGSSPRIKEVPSSSVTTASVPASNGRLTSISKESVMTSQLTSQQSQMVTDPNAVKGFLLPTYTPAEVQPGWGFTGEEGTSKQAADASMIAEFITRKELSGSLSHYGVVGKDNCFVLPTKKTLEDFNFDWEDLHPTPLREGTLSSKSSEPPQVHKSDSKLLGPTLFRSYSDPTAALFQSIFSSRPIQSYGSLVDAEFVQKGFGHRSKSVSLPVTKVSGDWLDPLMNSHDKSKNQSIPNFGPISQTANSGFTSAINTNVRYPAPPTSENRCNSRHNAELLQNYQSPLSSEIDNFLSKSGLEHEISFRNTSNSLGNLDESIGFPPDYC